MHVLSLKQTPNYNLNRTMPRAILMLLTVKAASGNATDGADSDPEQAELAVTEEFNYA